MYPIGFVRVRQVFKRWKTLSGSLVLGLDSGPKPLTYHRNVVVGMHASDTEKDFKSLDEPALAKILCKDWAVEKQQPGLERSYMMR